MCKFKSKTSALDEVRTKRNQKMPLIQFRMKLKPNVLTAFDDMFSNTVATRTSYTFDEVIYGAKFDTMYNRSKDGSKTILHLDKLNHYQSVNLS